MPCYNARNPASLSLSLSLSLSVCVCVPTFSHLLIVNKISSSSSSSLSLSLSRSLSRLLSLSLPRSLGVGGAGGEGGEETGGWLSGKAIGRWERRTDSWGARGHSRVAVTQIFPCPPRPTLTLGLTRYCRISSALSLGTHAQQGMHVG